MYNPEQRLAAAVLIRSLLDYNSRANRIKTDAKKWFRAKSRKPFGYFWCLENAEINPNLVKEYLDKCDKHRDEQINKLFKEKQNVIFSK